MPSGKRRRARSVPTFVGNRQKGTLVAAQRHSIPPASPHRAGHYTGLHPEDQPYQSTIMMIQSAPEQSHSPQQESAVPESESKRLPVVAERPFQAAMHPEDMVTLPLRHAWPTFHRDQPRRNILRARFVPTTLTIACLIFLVASSLLAYIFINRKPGLGSQTLSVMPAQLRVNDTFTLKGQGFGTHDLISFTHDKHNEPLLDGNGKALRTRADDLGTFSVQVVVPSTWQVGPHSIYAFDIGKEQSISVVATLTVQQSSSASPLLQLSTSSIDLGANVPGVVAKKEITLVNAGGQQLNWQASSDQAWLTVTPNSGTFSGSATVTIAANTGQLAPQSYAGHVTYIQQGSSNQPLTLTVTMTVKSAPPSSLLVSPVALTYSGTPAENPAPQTITLQNSASKPLAWSSTIGNSASWLSINPASGYLEAHASMTVTVNVQSQQLAVGSYQGTINFKGGANPQVTVALSVAATGNLIVSPPSLNFSSIGQNPASQVIAIQNSGGTTVTWTAATATVDGANWLTITPASGSLAAGQATNATVSVNVANLKPRSYQGSLTFSYGGATNQVAVSLTVSVPPVAAISLNLRALNFTTIKGHNPAPQSFTITNTGNATLNWSISEDQNGASFAPVSATSGSLAPTRSTVITVFPNVAQAGAGNLTTTLTVADSDRGTKVTSQKLTVNILIKDQAMITLSVNTMFFSHDSAITESSQLLDIKNTGSQTLNWFAQPSNSWLTAVVPSGSLAPGEDILIDVHCQSSGFSPGTYTSSLVIRDTDNGTPVVSQQVVVTMIVS
ncbi:MAG: BACON domain-containing protein [Ktedonobacteraceae bacterium]